MDFHRCTKGCREGERDGDSVRQEERKCQGKQCNCHVYKSDRKAIEMIEKRKREEKKKDNEERRRRRRERSKERVERDCEGSDVTVRRQRKE